jgi:hypothetical protein
MIQLLTLPFAMIHMTILDEEIRKRLVGYLGSDAAANITAEDEASLTKYEVPEVDVYVHLLVMIYLLDQNQLDKVQPLFRCLPGHMCAEEGREGGGIQSWYDPQCINGIPTFFSFGRSTGH